MITLRPYQERIAAQGLAILQDHGILCLSMAVRTGKTLTALTIADRVAAKRILFVTKKKAIPSIQEDYDTLNPQYTIALTNFERLHQVTGTFDLVIVDESHSIGAYPRPSQRAKRLRQLVGTTPLILLSGTPSPESYSQLFHQFWIAKRSPWAQYYNFYKWAEQYVNVFTQNFKGLPVKNYSKARQDMVWSSCKHLFLSITQEEAGFSAPVEEQILTVKLQPHAVLAYRKLKDKKILYQSEDVVATVNSGADLINKLCQISSGTLIYDGCADGRIIDVSKAHFILHYFAGKKIAIFYKYRAEYEVLRKFYPDHTSIPEEFNASGSLTFIGQVQSAREGTDLSSADALVMYNIDFSATSYWQARARIQSKDRQGSAPLYWIFSEHGIETKVYRAVQDKKNFTYSYYKKHHSNELELQRNPGSRVHAASTLF